MLGQLSLFGLAFFLVLAPTALCEQLAPSRSCASTGSLGWDGGVISGDLLDRHSTTDRLLHDESGLEHGAIGVALAHWWEPHSGELRRLKG